MIKGIQEETYPSNYISLRKERTEEKRKERKKKEEKWQRNKKDAFIYIYKCVCAREIVIKLHREKGKHFYRLKTHC